MRLLQCLGQTSSSSGEGSYEAAAFFFRGRTALYLSEWSLFFTARSRTLWAQAEGKSVGGTLGLCRFVHENSLRSRHSFDVLSSVRPPSWKNGGFTAEAGEMLKCCHNGQCFVARCTFYQRFAGLLQSAQYVRRDSGRIRTSHPRTAALSLT